MAGQPTISRFFKSARKREVERNALDERSLEEVSEHTGNNINHDEPIPNLNKNKKDSEKNKSILADESCSVPGYAVEIVDEVKIQEKGIMEHSLIDRGSSKRKLPDVFDNEILSKNVIVKTKKCSPLESSHNVKLTPLDQQVKELKEMNMDKLLVIRVGYKYKCFAQDAVIASQVLQIKLIAGKLTFDNSNPQDSDFKQFAYCSFPDTRLNVHLERLIHHDLKVAVVEQSETSAIKKYSKLSNKSQVFQRKITNIFSKATYGINNTFSTDSGSILGENNSIWALSISTTPNNVSNYTLLSVNLNKGEVIYDSFKETTSLSSELEMRLKYLDPKEIVTSTKFDDKVGRIFSKRHCVVNIQDIPDDLNPRIQDICYQLELDTKFSGLLTILFDYMRGYGNEEILLIPSTYKPFASSFHMILNSNTLHSLDIFINNGGKGSLFWVLDHTRTSFGSRELREWLSKPLLKKPDIEARLDAVECIKNEINNLFFESFNRILKGSPDLLRTLNRIAYGSTSRKEVYYFLKQLALLFDHFETHTSYLNDQLNSESGNIKKSSKLLTSILTDMFNYSNSAIVPRLLSMINVSAVLEKDSEKQITDYFNLNNYDHPEVIIKRQRQISAVQDELAEELKNIRRILQRPHMEYKNEIDYLIEVRNTQVKGLPSDWVKVNDTKMVSRFHTPKTVQLVEKLRYHKDLLLHEADEEFRHFLIRIRKEYDSLRRYIDNIAKYDAILALAATSCNQGYIRPIFTDEKQFIRAHNARNPVIESLDVNYVPNDIEMNEKSGKVMILTGPNMGGKSSYVRKVALLVILAQIGSFVPAEYFKLSLFDSIFTRIGAHDNILRGESTFKVELLEILQIIQGYSDDSLLLLDEVGRGTSTEDGKAIAYALLKYFLENQNCPLILFTTHYPLLGTISSDKLKNCYMDYVEEKKTGENWTSVVFLYKLRLGIARNSFGLNVAKLAGVDNTIINKAFEIVEVMKKKSYMSQCMALPSRMRSILSSSVYSSSEKVARLLEIEKKHHLPDFET